MSWKTAPPSKIVFGDIVDLLVRSWVEKQMINLVYNYDSRPPCEVVSWKTNTNEYVLHVIGRPPCEVVSWKVVRAVHRNDDMRRPPCEVVSWKNAYGNTATKCGTSTSLWGRELKNCSIFHNYSQTCRPPCEVVSWKTYKAPLAKSPRLSTSLWGRELKKC